MQFNKQQEEIINTIDGNVAVIAAAGSGKTSSLTERIKNMVDNYSIQPSSILAVTFSRKAKETIVNRLEKLGVINVNVETFHSIALKIITFASTKKFNVWTLQWEKEKVINDICSSLGLCSNPEDVPFNEIMTFIALQKTNMLKPSDELIYKEDIPFSNEDMKKIYVQYEDYKENKSYIEFDDFLNIVNDIFDKQPCILKKYQNAFQYVLVDEFQDVSMSQSLFLRKLNTKNTLIVGDPLQAIYSFRGGDSKYILNFDEEYKDVKVINLNTNYRCSKEIVSTANMLASTIPDSKDKNYKESVAANKENNKVPEVRHFKSDYDEYEFIAKKIEELKGQGYKYNDVAILARTNAQLQKLETILHKSDINFNVVDGKLFTEQPEIKLIISYFKLSLYENDDESFIYLYNKPNRWLNKKFMEETKENSIKRNVSLYNSMFTIDRRNWRFKNGIDEIHEVINYLQNKKYKNVGELVHYLRERLDIDTFVTKGKQSDDGKYTEQIENLNSFEDMCANYTTIHDLITYLDKLNKDMENIKGDSVKLLTIHKSKGMEFPVVFIVGCNDEILPHYKNNDIYDEKRLLYVAITRAEKELYLSYSDLTNGSFKEVSPFINDLKNTVNLIKNEESQTEK